MIQPFSNLKRASYIMHLGKKIQWNHGKQPRVEQLIQAKPDRIRRIRVLNAVIIKNVVQRRMQHVIQETLNLFNEGKRNELVL